MSLKSGTQLGNFIIGDPLGAGTMGEVYLAHDTKLDRKVAIKVLPESFAQNEKRLSRLEREAKTLASLDHPNIGALYDFQHEGDIHYLVLQFIDGETLAERIEKAPLPLDEALPIFIQIAHALEAAHTRNVVHRDLKPANIMVTPDGTVKVLDFGLAKNFGDGETSGSAIDSSLQSTAGNLTREGVAVGTPTYMSPEQARARNVDKRTDIWAFGCTLFEVLAGEPPFTGATVADLVAHILRDTPDFSLLPAETPSSVRNLVRRCLERDSRKRLKDAGDIAITLEDAHESLGDEFHPEPKVAAQTAPHQGHKSRYLVLSLAASLLILWGAAIWWWTTRPDPASSPSEELAGVEVEPKPVRRFSIGLSADYPIKRPNPVIGDNPLALSPDGSTLVYVSELEGKTQLVARRLDQLEARPIPGSEYAWSPFFSPDGLWIGYQQRGNEQPKLMKIPVEGGVPVPLADSEIPFGGSWGEDGDIIFGQSLGSGVWRVLAEGGAPEMITTPDREAGESLHAYPQVLPGGDALLVMAGMMPPDADHGRIIVKNLKTKELLIVADDVGGGKYVPSGHIVYPRAGELLAVPFDLHTLEITGSEVPVTESRMAVPGAFPRSFTFGAEGTMVYIPLDKDTGEARTLVWVDREGNEEPIALPVRPYSSVRISPDGTRLAVDHINLENVWVCDLSRGSTQRLTFAEGSNYRPIWASDGKSIIFLSSRLEFTAIYSKRADGVGETKRIVTDPGYPYPEAISPDGKTLVFRPVASVEPTLYVSMDGEGEPTVLLEGKFNERNLRISPNGKWMSYESAETGRFEIYVQSFPDAGAKWQVSIEGGQQAVWNPDGSELFYWEGVRLMAVDIEVEPIFSARDPKPLFEMPSKVSYDIAPDGDRFVVIKEGAGTAWATELIVVENWFEELKRLAPAKTED